MEGVQTAQPMMGMPMANPAPATGVSAWMDKETLWFIVKVLLFVGVIIIGMMYFYNKSKDRAAEKVTASVKDKQEEGDE